MNDNEIISLAWHAGIFDDDDDEKQDICEYCKTRLALAENYGVMCGDPKCREKFDIEMAEKKSREKEAKEKEAKAKQEIKAKNAKLKQERKIKRNANKSYRLFKFSLKIVFSFFTFIIILSIILNELGKI